VEVIKEVPKEVEKIVNVPAEIPYEYIVAKDLRDKMTNATLLTNGEYLFGMKDIRVMFTLDDAVKQVLTEDEIRAKFELVLRRNNVPINPKSQNILTVAITGFFDVSNPILCYSFQDSVAEIQFVARNGELHLMPVVVWNKGDEFGTVGKLKANEGLLRTSEKCAEIFANDFLASNPKK
jgi:hypothetical protein